MTPQTIATRTMSMWDQSVSPQRGSTPKPRTAAGIDPVFPMLHTPYKHY
jgi:hypothetical protein